MEFSVGQARPQALVVGAISGPRTFFATIKYIAPLERVSRARNSSVPHYATLVGLLRDDSAVFKLARRSF